MYARSYLYVPGDRPALFDKATRSGADAIILDLEDAVVPAHKHESRRAAAEWLGARAEPRPSLWVRVNASNDLADDVRAVVGPNLAGLVLPKATLDLVLRAAEHLDRAEQASNLLGGSLAIFALLESAAGLLEALEIGRHPRVTRVALGETDLCADLGVDRDEYVLHPLRMQLVVACAAGGRAAPVASTADDFGDIAGLRRSTAARRRAGFVGRTAIHPAQVAVINEVFTPSTEETTRAHELLARFDAAVDGGSGVVKDAENRVIDVAAVRRARQIIELASLINKSTSS